MQLSENCDFIWRLCKSMYLSAVALGQEGDTEGRKDLVFIKFPRNCIFK